MLEVKATSKYVRTSAQKAGLVLALIRGKKAAEAISILRFTKKSVARDIEKTLRSAIANAVYVADRNQKRRLDEDDLFVSAAYAGNGPSFKRVRPAPMGRAFQIIKRTTHLTVCVAEGEVKKKGRTRAEKKSLVAVTGERKAETPEKKPAAPRARARKSQAKAEESK